MCEIAARDATAFVKGSILAYQYQSGVIPGRSLSYDAGQAWEGNRDGLGYLGNSSLTIHATVVEQIYLALHTGDGVLSDRGTPTTRNN